MSQSTTLKLEQRRLDTHSHHRWTCSSTLCGLPFTLGQPVTVAATSNAGAMCERLCQLRAVPASQRAHAEVVRPVLHRAQARVLPVRGTGRWSRRLLDAASLAICAMVSRDREQVDVDRISAVRM